MRAKVLQEDQDSEPGVGEVRQATLCVEFLATPERVEVALKCSINPAPSDPTLPVPVFVLDSPHGEYVRNTDKRHGWK